MQYVQLAKTVWACYTWGSNAYHAYKTVQKGFYVARATYYWVQEASTGKDMRQVKTTEGKGGIVFVDLEKEETEVVEVKSKKQQKKEKITQEKLDAEEWDLIKDLGDLPAPPEASAPPPPSYETALASSL